MNIIEKYYENISTAYPVYNRLDPQMKKVAYEMAVKYPYCTEHIAKIIVANGFDEKEAEKQIQRELMSRTR